MGSRELSNRADLKQSFRRALLPAYMSAQDQEALANALAERFHATPVPGEPAKTIAKVLDIIMGVGG
jgi:hypothetical protein